MPSGRKITDEELAEMPEAERNKILNARARKLKYRIEGNGKLKDKEYREKNKEKYKEWVNNNLDKVKENRLKSYNKNLNSLKEYWKTDEYKEKIKIYRNSEKGKETYKRCKIKYYNSEKGKETKKIYFINYIERNKHTEKWKASKIAIRNRRKHLQKKIHINELHYTEILFIKNKFNNQCFNCESTNKLCLDHHYPLSKGYPLIEKNAVVLCNSCNASKANKLPQNFYTEAKIKQLETFFDIATHEEMDQYKKAI